MSHDKSSDSGVRKLLRLLEQKSRDSDKTASDKSAAKGSTKVKKVTSTENDKSTTDKSTKYDKKLTPKDCDKNTTEKRETHDKKVTSAESNKRTSDKPSATTSIDDKKLTSIDTTSKFAPKEHQIDDPKSFSYGAAKEITANIDKKTTRDKETIPDKMISDGSVSGGEICDASANDMALSSVSDKAKNEASRKGRETDKETASEKVIRVEANSDSRIPHVPKRSASISDIEAFRSTTISISDKDRTDKQTWNKPVEETEKLFHPEVIRLRSDNWTTDKSTLLTSAKVTDSRGVISEGYTENKGHESGTDDNATTTSISDKAAADYQATLCCREDMIMIDDVIKTRLISDATVTDTTAMIRPLDIGTVEVTDNREVIDRRLTDDPVPISCTTDNSTAVRLFSDGDTRDKPARTDSAKAKRPDVLSLSPRSPSDTDEDGRTPRPLSGSFRSADVTPVLESSLVELPLRFRQYLDGRPVSPTEPLHPGTSCMLKSGHENEDSKEGRDAHEKQKPRDVHVTTRDAHVTTRDVNDDKGREDDISVALDWIQQELRQMKGKDRTLVRQLLGLGASIHQLRGLTDCHSFNPDESTSTGGDRSPDWSSPVQPSMSADLSMILADPVSSSSRVKSQAKEAVVSRRSLETVSSSTRCTDPKEFYV